MGGSAEPDGLRGFGRVHLEAGLPLSGSGDTALFVLDAADRSTGEDTVTEFYFNLNSATGVDMRATLAWIDPAASEVSSIQLVNDLDLAIASPSGSRHQMWSTGADSRNVVERVIVSADDIDSDNGGEWIVSITAQSLATTTQSYSLVVTGPMTEDSGREGSYEYTGAAHVAIEPTRASCIVTAAATLGWIFAFGVWEPG